MKNMKTSITIILCLCATITAFAQIKVDTDGRILLGRPTDNPAYNDPAKFCSINVFGLGSDTYRSGSKISFGDVGQFGGLNAFVGEFGSYDSDILSLHGKGGIYFSTGGSLFNGGSPNVVAKLEPSGDFKIAGIVIPSQVNLNSDIRLKKNIKSMTGADCLSKIKQLNAISYDYKTEKEDSMLLSIAESLKNTKNREKDIASLQSLKKSFETKKIDMANQMGYSAQDLQKVIPALVRADENSMLSVNYIALIPVITEALKEQQATIEAQRAEIEAMKKDIIAIKKKIGL
jgi:Chaperone of endosialidase